MSINKSFNTGTATIFQHFINTFHVSEIQEKQFNNYLNILLEWNERYNLTTIIEPDLIIRDHFIDSVMITKFLDFSKVQSIGDIGSGAGFPGIPLKILNPTRPVYLIEVNNKRIRFLEEVITQLELKHIEVCALDWRTFLRKTHYSINLFVSRASLHADELIKMFKPSCNYNQALLAYWASQHWAASPMETPFLKDEISYMLDNKRRYYVFFAHNPLIMSYLQKEKTAAEFNNLPIEIKS